MTMKQLYGMVCLALMLAVPARAEWNGASGIDIKRSMGLDLEYSDNVFHLDDDGSDRLESPDQDDVDSGRVYGMDSDWDLILSPRLGFSASLGSPFGGTLGLSSWVKYHVYTQNSEKSYPEIKISLDQDMGKRGRISWSWIYLDNYFKSNELYSVSDVNGNGNIAGDERVYAQAEYDEHETSLAYTMRLFKNKDGRLSGVDVAPEIGWSDRTYGDLFPNRDRTVLFAGLTMNLEFMRDLELELSYRYDTIDSPNGEELILYDETVDNSDVNNDGDIDKNAALTTRVDRSCRRHVFGIRPQWAVNKKLSVFAGYEWRKTELLSDNVLDEKHYGQTEVRQKVRAGLTYAFTRKVSAKLTGTHIDDDAAENDDYTENTLSLQVKYRFP